MIKPSNGFIIFGKDLKSGLVKKKEYKGLTEYWIYQGTGTDIYLPNGSKADPVDRSEIELSAIIVCEGSAHITAQRKKGFLVNGVKFTDHDLKNYLDKTKRSVY